MSHNRLIDRGDHSVITTTVCTSLYLDTNISTQQPPSPSLVGSTRTSPLRKYRPLHQPHSVLFDSQSRMQSSTPFIRVILNASFHRITNVFPLPSGPSTV